MSVSAPRVHPTNAFSEFRKSEVEQSIAARFEKQVLLHRDRLALRTAAHNLSYEQLNHLANRLAHAIERRSGAEPAAVAILLDHDAPLIAAILAVLKAGRFYIALEPSHPADRLRNILEDSGADLLVTDAAHYSQAEAIARPKCAILNFDALEPEFSVENLARQTPPSALAYLVYTSGSTGQPKGVCQTHRNVLHNTRKYTNACHLGADDRFSLLALCSFSASVSNLFGALLNGAALMPFKAKEEGIARLLTWLQKEEISIYHSVPLVFRNLARTIANEKVVLPKLRLIKLGGDSITRADVDLYKRHFSDRALLYIGLGSSEMNCVRYWLLDQETEFDGPLAPVGYAAEDTEVLLLDEKQQEVPAGETGEIAIRSAYLFPGYWRKPELTEAAFLPDPNGKGARVFRTGDLGRMLPGELLQHLGRSEYQIKIRGARIQPAEVEFVLRSQPEIDDCAVLAKDIGGEKQLIAYLTNGTGIKPEGSALRSRLAAKLPEYMLPARFVWLDELPLINGKIDRQALQKLPIPALASTDDDFVAPRNDLERKLAEIWRRVLRPERVGVRDNFWELGGDSLSATQVAVEIDALFGRKLPVAALFRAATIEALARHLTEEDSAPPLSSLVPLQPEGSLPPLFIIHGWGGDVCFYNELARLLPDRSAYGLQAVGLDGKEPRHVTIEQMATHYLDEIRTVQSHGPYHFIGYSLGCLIAFEVACQAYERGERVDFLGLLDPPTRSAPWLPYARTIAPLLAGSARYHLGRWVRSGGRESFHFKRRMKRLRRWIKRNQPNPRAVIAPPECSSTPPAIPGFKDYYSAVSSPYQLRRYPGAIDLIIGDNVFAPLLPLWQHLAKGGARYHRVSCTHKEMIQRDFLPMLAATLHSAMAERASQSAK